MLTSSQHKAAARSFAARWKVRGYEKGETQKFWLEILKTVLGVERPFDHIEFESQVVLDHTNLIDAYIPSAKVLVEQKSLGKASPRGRQALDWTPLPVLTQVPAAQPLNQSSPQQPNPPSWPQPSQPSWPQPSQPSWPT